MNQGTGFSPVKVLLKDNVTIATIFPISSLQQAPKKLRHFLQDEFNSEIIKDTNPFPFTSPLATEEFEHYWFTGVVGVVVLGDRNRLSLDSTLENESWDNQCLGTFTMHSNFSGQRSRDVGTGQFLVNAGARRKGIGALMLNCFELWAIKLEFTKIVFNLIYSNNIPMIKLLGKVRYKKLAIIKSSLEYNDDILMFERNIVDTQGRSLVKPTVLRPITPNFRHKANNPLTTIKLSQPQGGPDITLEMSTSIDDFKRWKEVLHYMITKRYPEGVSRREKANIRSRSHLYQLRNGKLYLNNKRVIMEPAEQARYIQKAHIGTGHSGINRTVSTITDVFHWNRIKDSVTQYIKHCTYCEKKEKWFVPAKEDKLFSDNDDDLTEEEDDPEEESLPQNRTPFDGDISAPLERQIDEVSEEESEEDEEEEDEEEDEEEEDTRDLTEILHDQKRRRLERQEEEQNAYENSSPNMHEQGEEETDMMGSEEEDEDEEEEEGSEEENDHDYSSVANKSYEEFEVDEGDEGVQVEQEDEDDNDNDDDNENEDEDELATMLVQAASRRQKSQS